MEIEISNFLGIQSSNISPPKNACVICDNLDVRSDTGALVTRMGYDNKYDSPVDSRGKLSGQADIGFCNFYIPDNGGQEITILLQKATLAGETGIGYATPSSLNILVVWARPYWGLVISGSISSATTTTVTTNITTTANQYVNKYIISGSETRKILSHTTGVNTVFTTELFTTVPSGTCYINGWIDSWLWLNQCVLTTVNTVGSSDKRYKMFLDFADATLKTDGFNNWVIHNITQSKTAKIIDTYEGSVTNQIAVKISNNSHSWINTDSVLIMRNYIPYEYLTGMYSCTIADVVFHKILNDIRIGFGGQENRIGLSVGYRKKYFRFNLFEVIYSSGTVDIFGTTTIGESTKTWTVNEWAGYTITITGGTGIDQTRVIISNTATTLTVATWTTTPDATSVYKIEDTDLIDSTVKENFAKIDGIILDVYNCLGMEASLDLVAISDTALPLAEDTYYFKAVGRLDDYESFVLAESSINVGANFNIVANVFLNAGKINKRLTDVGVYWGTDNILFYRLYELEFSKLTYEASKFTVDVYGNFKVLAEIGTDNLNVAADAILPATSPSTDTNSIGDWLKQEISGGTYTLTSVATAPTPSAATYTGSGRSLKLLQSVADRSQCYLYKDLSYILPGQSFYLSFDIQGYDPSAGGNGISVQFGFGDSPGDGDNRWVESVPYGSWKTVAKIFSIENTTDNVLWFLLSTRANNSWLAIDNLFIRYSADEITANSESSQTEDEILDELGYSPTTNLALSWDQAIVTKGKCFMANPYFADGGRILNNIFYSPFSGNGERQYDVITPGKFFPLDSFDGNDLIGLQVLSNLDFLGIRRNSVQWIDSDTGISKEVRYGNGVVNNRGVVNFGEHVVYPGENDISLVNPLRAIDISEGTIRTLYRALTKANIIATREEKDNAYRFFTGDTTTKQEYILTKKGWIGAKRYLYPKTYAIAKDGTVWFLGSDSRIYYDETIDGDNGAPISYNWRSVVFDQSLLGESIKGDVRFFIQSLWFRYKLIYPATTFTVKLYLDKACKASDYAAGETYILGDVVVYGGTRWKSLQNSNTGHTPAEGSWWTAVSYYQSFSVDANYGYFAIPIIPGASCREFQIDISGTDDFGSKVEIYAVGIEFTVIPIGLYAKIP